VTDPAPAAPPSALLKMVRASRHLITAVCVVLVLVTVVSLFRSALGPSGSWRLLAESGQVFLPAVFLFVLFNNLAHRYPVGEAAKGRLKTASRVCLGLAVLGFVMGYLYLRRTA